MYGKPIRHTGSTDLERRDRATGALLTLLGLFAIIQLPDAAAALGGTGSGSFGRNFLYHLYFALGFLVIIGPCLMLPHRAGVLPLALACLFAFSQIEAEINGPETLERMTAHAAEAAAGKRAGVRPLGG